MNGNPQTPAPHHIALRDLPLAARLTLALFLLSVGIGYVSALVQLHFQHAAPGELLPTSADAVKTFFGHVGEKPKCKIEQLLPEDHKGKMTSQGTMTPAFYDHSDDYKTAISKRAQELAKNRGGKAKDKNIREAATAEIDKERDGERRAMIAWTQAGANETAYDDDNFPLPDDLAKQPLTRAFLVEDGDKLREPHAVKIKSLFQDRCVRCHTDGGEAKNFPLDTFAGIKKCSSVKTANGMSLEKLAQTTHVHLLGFSMLYGLTGLILAFSSYPRWLRVLLCPLPLLVQVVDISFWWLARLAEPYGPWFAEAIVVSGAIVAVGLLLHVVLGLFNLFRLKGWLVLILLFGIAGFAGYVAKTRVIDPFIAQEQAPNP